MTGSAPTGGPASGGPGLIHSSFPADVSDTSRQARRPPPQGGTRPHILGVPFRGHTATENSTHGVGPLPGPLGAPPPRRPSLAGSTPGRPPALRPTVSFAGDASAGPPSGMAPSNPDVAALVGAVAQLTAPGRAECIRSYWRRQFRRSSRLAVGQRGRQLQGGGAKRPRSVCGKLDLFFSSLFSSFSLFFLFFFYPRLPQFLYSAVPRPSVPLSRTVGRHPPLSSHTRLGADWLLTNACNLTMWQNRGLQAQWRGCCGTSRC